MTGKLLCNWLQVRWGVAGRGRVLQVPRGALVPDMEWRVTPAYKGLCLVTGKLLCNRRVGCGY